MLYFEFCGLDFEFLGGNLIFELLYTYMYTLKRCVCVHVCIYLYDMGRCNWQKLLRNPNICAIIYILSDVNISHIFKW